MSANYASETVATWQLTYNAGLQGKSGRYFVLNNGSQLLNYWSTTGFFNG